ncbi:hypothetical protein LNP74_22795 [Klebsiella pneumoniae subsp. pneumoniae]|nr:hypothetical protein [Klebsiella pneumoniae subsp. pneumoniae]
MPEGAAAFTAHRGNEYQIASADGSKATVVRLVNGAVDESWPGFTARTMIDYEATGLNDTLSWLGPYSWFALKMRPRYVRGEFLLPERHLWL